MSTTISGNIKDLDATAISGGTMRFWLRGTGGNQPRVNGTALIAPSQGGVFFFDLVSSSSGVISGTLYSTRDSAGTGDGDIEVGGSKTAVWYGMQAIVNGKSGPEIPVHAKSGSTLDISNVTPITTTPVATAPDGDSTYVRVDNGNGPYSLSFKNLNSILFADQFSGSDIGAKINAAYAVLPDDGGTIVIPAGTYSFSTPIVFGSSGKYPTLVGSPRGTILTFSPSSGTAITCNPGNAGLPLGWGIRDLKLIVTNDTADGVLLGGSNGGVGFYGLNVQVQGAGHNLLLDDNVQGVVFDHWVFAEGMKGFYFPTGLTQTGEGIEFRSCFFSHSSVWATDYVHIVSQASDNADVTFINCHLDSVQYTQESGDVKFYKLHMENPSNFSIGPNYYAKIAGGVVTFLDPLMASEQVNVPTGFITLEGSTGIVIGANFQNTSSSIVGINVNASGILTYLGQKNVQGTITLFQFADGAKFAKLDNNDLSLLNGSGTAQAILKNNSGATVAGITGTLLGWLQSGVAHLGEIDTSGNLGLAGALCTDGDTPTLSGTAVGFGKTTGFGNGSGTAVTTTAIGTGSGPTTAQTVVKYLKIDIGGTKYWIPLMQ